MKTGAVLPISTSRLRCSGVRLPRRFKQRKHRALRVRDDRPRTHIVHLPWWHQDFAAELGSFLRGCFRACHLEVKDPMWRSLRVAMLRGRNAADKIFAVFDMNVSERIFGVFHHLPAKKPGIEFARALRIRCAEISPADRVVNS